MALIKDFEIAVYPFICNVVECVERYLTGQVCDAADIGVKSL